MTGTRRGALVTGASWGIGHATAVALARDGFDVAVSDLTTDALAKTVAAVEAEGRRAVPVALDVRDQASVEAAVRTASAALPGLDTLVNNAGVPSAGKNAVDLSRAEWDGILAVNLTGAFFMSAAIGRLLIDMKRPGCVISLASTHGTVGFAGASAYGIAKAGISHMTRMLAIEWASHNIRVNAIAPGTTMTESRRPCSPTPNARSACYPAFRLGASARPRKWRARSPIWRVRSHPTSPARSCCWTAV